MDHKSHDYQHTLEKDTCSRTVHGNSDHMIESTTKIYHDLERTSKKRTIDTNPGIEMHSNTDLNYHNSQWLTIESEVKIPAHSKNITKFPALFNDNLNQPKIPSMMITNKI